MSKARKAKSSAKAEDTRTEAQAQGDVLVELQALTRLYLIHSQMASQAQSRILDIMSGSIADPSRVSARLESIATDLQAQLGQLS